MLITHKRVVSKIAFRIKREEQTASSVTIETCSDTLLIEQNDPTPLSQQPGVGILQTYVFAAVLMG